MKNLTIITNEYLELLLVDASLQEMLNYGSRSIGNPLMLIDASQNLLCVSGHENVTDYTWIDYIAGKPTWNDYSNNRLVYQMMRNVSKEEGIFLTDEEPGHPRRYAIKLTSGHQELGFIFCLEQNAHFNDETLPLLKVIVKMLSIKMLRLNHDFTKKDDVICEELVDLIKNINGEELYASHYLESFFVKNNNQKYRVFNIPYKPDDYTEDEFRHLLFSFNNLARLLKVAVLDNEIILLLIEKADRHIEIIEKLKDMASINALYVGISSAFEDFSNLEMHLTQAKDCAEYAYYLHTPHVIVYNDNIVNLMLFRNSKREDMKTYLPDELRLLIEYDKENDSHLIETLRYYFANSCNISKTANNMYLHRNTVVYRINRIQELCNCDLTNVDTIVLFSLSLKLLELGLIKV